eukprot:SAG11_NODE_29892_length_306_cov_0.739130_1_plen_66_part_01
MQVEATLHEESMETLKRWYQQKWVAIQSSRLQHHFSGKLEAEQRSAAEEKARWEVERDRLAGELHS